MGIVSPESVHSTLLVGEVNDGAFGETIGSGEGEVRTPGEGLKTGETGA